MRRAALLAVVLLATACGATPPARSEPAPAGHTCTSDADCADGMACCYPCGVDGCENACMAVGPSGCPELP